MLRQTLINLVIAETILQRFCVEQVPSLHRIVPRYLRPVTDSSFWPFMLISAPMSLVLLVMIVFFSVPSAARAVGHHRPLLCAQCRSCCWSSSSSSLCRVSFYKPLLGVLSLLVKSLSSPLVPFIRSMLFCCMVYIISLYSMVYIISLFSMVYIISLYST